MVAGFEVEGDSRVWNTLQIHGQHLLRHVIIIQLIVTQSHIHIQGKKVPVEFERDGIISQCCAVDFQCNKNMFYMIIFLYKCILLFLRDASCVVKHLFCSKMRL